MPGYIFIEQPNVEEVRDSGLIITSKHVTNNRGTITHLHEDTAKATGLAVGTQIVFNAFATREVMLDGTTPRLALVADDVLAVIEA